MMPLPAAAGWLACRGRKICHKGYCKGGRESRMPFLTPRYVLRVMIVAAIEAHRLEEK